MKRGKRYVDSAKKIDRTVQYESADAIKLVKENATAKFDETIELVVGMVPPWPASVMILEAAGWPLKTATPLRTMTYANSSAV